ncbi:alkaline phosphatase family protein [Pseudoalteromonas luteoviolacea]|uniref:alkaline phosphatase D family protein n=1 Tax=Pseudoalteromonas luteoviolacea TaxID=43657 RepID=UPI001B3791DE|nr:alkaline phosphatase D family protein [Pseudoalteromonas luteoviolacea]MBQ4811204.1 alkaline phosphatase family protein [Pseudoalteromonas luteoviolacea]
MSMQLRHAFDSEKLVSCLNDAIIIGHVSYSTAKVWVRSKHRGKHYIVLSDTPIQPDEINIDASDTYSALQIGFSKVSSVTLDDTTDRTDCIEFQNLQPSTRYWVALIADHSVPARRQWRSGYEIPATFKTQQTNAKSLVFGFFSCHDPYKKGHGPEDIFLDIHNRLNELNGDFVIAGGDQVYVDSSTKEFDVWRWVTNNKEQLKPYFEAQDQAGLIKALSYFYRFIYRLYWQSAHFQKLVRSFPTYMIWDDHEIMDGWGSLTEDELSDKLDTLFEWEDSEFNLFIAHAMFHAAAQVYQEYQHSHNPTTPTLPHTSLANSQWDYSFTHNLASFYVLDQRGHHKFQNPAGYDLLGSSQFSRLSHWFENIPSAAKAIFIVSPVPVVHWSCTVVNMADLGSYKDDFRDEWDHEANHQERNELLDLAFNASQKHQIPVVFLSGDVHCAASFKLKRRSNSGTVYQFTASGVTRKPAPFVSKAISCAKGTLSGCDVLTTFERLAFGTQNNFGIMKLFVEGEQTHLVAEHISTTDEEDETLIKQVRLV